MRSDGFLGSYSPDRPNATIQIFRQSLSSDSQSARDTTGPRDEIQMMKTADDNRSKVPFARLQNPPFMERHCCQLTLHP